VRPAVAADPGHLGRGEVRIEGQPGQLPQLLRVIGEFRADRLGAPVLPDQRVGERAAGGRVPGEDGLALVGEAERDDVLAGLGERAPAGLDHRVVQLARVRLDQAAGEMTRADLGEAGAEDTAFGADDERLGAGGALVDGEHRPRHRASPVPDVKITAPACRRGGPGVKLLRPDDRRRRGIPADMSTALARWLTWQQ
jgi:hypothetical protein